MVSQKRIKINSFSVQLIYTSTGYQALNISNVDKSANTDLKDQRKTEKNPELNSFELYKSLFQILQRLLRLLGQCCISKTPLNKYLFNNLSLPKGETKILEDILVRAAFQYQPTEWGPQEEVHFIRLPNAVEMNVAVL